MAGTPGASKRFRIGVQNAKGVTPTLFICATMQMSGITPERDAIDPGVEHGCAGESSDYATAHKTATEYSSYMVTGRGRGMVYPSVIGTLLHMVGFNVVATAKTGYTEHVANVATRTQYGWGAIWDEIADLSQLVKDVRATKLVLDISKAGLIWNADFLGLSVTDTVGSPTVENEETFKLLPGKGTMTFATLGAGPINLVADLPRASTIQFDNPLDTDTEQLTVLGRSDLPQNGLDISGTVKGCTVAAANYKALYDWTANKPGGGSKLASISQTYQAAANIVGAAVPYSIKIDVPRAEVTLPAFDADGGNRVSFDYNWRMVADTATPCTITIANTIEDYTP